MTEDEGHPLGGPSSSDESGARLRFAYALSGPRAGEELNDDDAIATALEASDLAWLHMKAHDPASADWIESHLAYLDRSIRAALIAEETRPRALPIEAGLMLILRGVNTNPGAEPEDMVSLRLWIDPARIVSLSRRPLASVADIARDVAEGRGPDRAGVFLCRLLDRLGVRMETELSTLVEETDALEDDVLRAGTPQLRQRITDARQRVVDLRRYLAPQRDALATVMATRLDWLGKSDRRNVAEAHERLIRHVEELDAIRDRLVVIRDELQNAQAERLNRNLYILSVVSVLFMPLGFLTGLMGINLAGMPGAEWSGAFWTFVGMLAGVVVVQVAILRWLRLF